MDTIASGSNAALGIEVLALAVIVAAVVITAVTRGTVRYPFKPEKAVQGNCLAAGGQAIHTRGARSRLLGASPLDRKPFSIKERLLTTAPRQRAPGERDDFSCPSNLRN